MEPEERARLCRLANEEIDLVVERLRAAGMPDVGVCGALLVNYAHLARTSGATLEQAMEQAIESVARAFGVDTTVTHRHLQRNPQEKPS